MSAESYSVREGDDVRGALAKMLGQGVAELPVVDGAGRPIGLLNLPSILAVTGEMVDEPEASVSEAAPSAREVA